MNPNIAQSVYGTLGATGSLSARAPFGNGDTGGQAASGTRNRGFHTRSQTVSRRQFIRTSSAALALPWLESLSAAAAPPSPRRMVAICTGFGLYGPSFFPKQPGRDYTVSKYLEILGDLRDQFTVFSGISHPQMGGDHASESCFLTSAKDPRGSNFRNTISLDQVAARHVGNATRFGFLSLRTNSAGSALSHTANGVPIPPLDSPSNVFARLFLAGNPKEVAAELERLKRGQSILDRMGQQFSSLNGRLSPHDRRQIGDYVDAVRDMEKQLHAAEDWVHRPKPKVEDPVPMDIGNNGDVIGRARLMLNLTRLALQTDSTRVVSLFIKGEDLVPPIKGVTQDHHNLSHHGNDPVKLEQLQVIERAKMAALRDFLAALRDTHDGAGSLLDHTQVLIGSNLGEASSHSTFNLPILLAGGGWKHGRHIAGDPKNNTPLCNLFVSMLQRFGVETDRFGSSTGTMGGLA